MSIDKTEEKFEEQLDGPTIVSAVMGEMQRTPGFDALLKGEAPAFLRKPADTILQEAETIVYGDRERTYGHPSKNFDATARLWSAHLYAKYGVEIPLDYNDVAWMMVQLKQAREMHSPKRDNLVDAAGYVACIQKVRDYEGDE